MKVNKKVVNQANKMFLTEVQARNSYNSGKILENRQNQKFVRIFQLCSLRFSSTEKRAKKGKQYRLDNPYWKIHSVSLIEKLKMIFNKEVKLIKRKG